jgi:S-adenosylmethionine-diacylglycerol 3-amino-3-carboxypropyl transferase
MSYILTGNYSVEDGLPVYLRKENFKRISDRLDRVELVSQDCKDYFRSLPSDSITKFNFTNIFEWMTEREFEQLLNEVIRIAKDDSLITYRNLLVSRSAPLSLQDRIKRDFKLSEDLHLRDRSFIYQDYIVEKIHK